MGVYFSGVTGYGDVCLGVPLPFSSRLIGREPPVAAGYWPRTHPSPPSRRMHIAFRGQASSSRLLAEQLVVIGISRI